MIVLLLILILLAVMLMSDIGKAVLYVGFWLAWKALPWAVLAALGVLAVVEQDVMEYDKDRLPYFLFILFAYVGAWIYLRNERLRKERLGEEDGDG